ncbi:MAG: hypothetical protein OXD01_10540 [Gammaproteobacteria bacterium]|nr:hypothetical protein [Gammaproteobacteria bacterium]
MAFKPSRRTGEFLFWQDTQSSALRLAKGISIAVTLGLIVSLAAGSIPLIAAPLNPMVIAVLLISPMAILPVFYGIRPG